MQKEILNSNSKAETKENQFYTQALKDNYQRISPLRLIQLPNIYPCSKEPMISKARLNVFYPRFSWLVS